jgi:hypothetical protein
MVAGTLQAKAIAFRQSGLPDLDDREAIGSEYLRDLSVARSKRAFLLRLSHTLDDDVEDLYAVSRGGH